MIPLGKGNPIRWKKAHALDYMDKHFSRYNFLTNKMNLYHSIAKYDNMPLMSYNARIQKQQQEEWKKNFHKHIKSYDFFIETDSDEDFLQAWKDALELQKIFDKFNLRYYVKFSGTKGFHFLMPYEAFSFLDCPVYNIELETGTFKQFIKKFPMKSDKLKTDIVRLFRVLATRIKTLSALDTVDITVQDVKRVCKVAYSIDDKSGLIAYPLNDYQFHAFVKNDYTPEKVLRMNNYKRRLLWRNTDKKPDVKGFLEEFGVIK